MHTLSTTIYFKSQSPEEKKEKETEPQIECFCLVLFGSEGADLSCYHPGVGAHQISLAEAETCTH